MFVNLDRSTEVVSCDPSASGSSTLLPVPVDGRSLFRSELSQMFATLRQPENDNLANICRHAAMESAHPTFYQILHSTSEFFTRKQEFFCPLALYS